MSTELITRHIHQIGKDDQVGMRSLSAIASSKTENDSMNVTDVDMSLMVRSVKKSANRIAVNLQSPGPDSDSDSQNSNDETPMVIDGDSSMVVVHDGPRSDENDQHVVVIGPEDADSKSNSVSSTVAGSVVGVGGAAGQVHHHHHYHYFYHHHFHHLLSGSQSQQSPPILYQSSPLRSSSLESDKDSSASSSTSSSLSQANSLISPSITTTTTTNQVLTPTSPTTLSLNTSALVRTISNGSTFGPITDWPLVHLSHNRHQQLSPTVSSSMITSPQHLNLQQHYSSHDSSSSTLISSLTHPHLVNGSISATATNHQSIVNYHHQQPQPQDSTIGSGIQVISGTGGHRATVPPLFDQIQASMMNSLANDNSGNNSNNVDSVVGNSPINNNNIAANTGNSQQIGDSFEANNHHNHSNSAHSSSLIIANNNDADNHPQSNNNVHNVNTTTTPTTTTDSNSQTATSIANNNNPIPTINQQQQPQYNQYNVPQPQILATTPAQSCLPNFELPLSFGENFILTSQIEASNLYRCIDTKTMEEYCCKIVLSKNYYDFLAGHLRMDGHVGINQVEKIVVGRVHTFVLFLPSYGDLHSYVRTKRRLREPEAMALFQQIVQIVADCHSNGIILRDLKLRKFIFSNKQRTQLKLETLEGASLFEDDDDTLADKHGCPAYVSPEILYSNSYSGMAADCWSLGVILYTMLVGRYPFHDTNPSVVFCKIRRGTYYIPETLSKHAKCLVRSLIRIDPNHRLTTQDALAHRWFKTARSPTVSSIILKRSLQSMHHHHYHHHSASSSSSSSSSAPQNPLSLSHQNASTASSSSSSSSSSFNDTTTSTTSNNSQSSQSLSQPPANPDTSNQSSYSSASSNNNNSSSNSSFQSMSSYLASHHSQNSGSTSIQQSPVTAQSSSHSHHHPLPLCCSLNQSVVNSMDQIVPDLIID